MDQATITLFTRRGCHLCDQAKDVLHELQEEWDFALEEVDIAASDELTERYGLMIPVILIDGEEAAYGFVNKSDISNRLREKKQEF